MVGTGVFTSLGFQLAGGVTNVAAIIILWLIGGIIAFTGAQVYGELGSVMPRSGGEYHFLSQIYHPSVGFMSGFFSMFAGFAAPVALAAMALGEYMDEIFPWMNPKLIAAVVIILTTIVHCISVSFGGAFQNVFTFMKILLVIGVIVAGLFFAGEAEPVSFIPTEETWNDVLTPGFAVCLIYVFYSYSGWNAAAYFVSDMKDPVRNLPKSLLLGTGIVTILYVLLNFVFLRVAPAEELSGQLEVGAIAANHIFGKEGGHIMSAIISLLLISSISSMIFAGPRVIQVIGEDYKHLSFMRRKTKNGVPVLAICIQSFISLSLLFTSTFDILLTYLGFCMNVFCFLTVMGIFIHRFRYPNIERPFRAWGYPITPLIFMAFFVWNFIYMFTEKLEQTAYGIGTLLVSFLVYQLVKNSKTTK